MRGLNKKDAPGVSGVGLVTSMPCDPALKGIILPLFPVLPGVLSYLLVDQHMTGPAEGLQVGVAELLHPLSCLRRLHRYLVVDVDGTHIVSLLLAYLTERMGLQV